MIYEFHFFRFLERSEPVANRQYVLMYPSYQLIATRQDAPGNTNPFQQFLGFIGFGQNTQTATDAVEMDKPEAQPQAQPQTPAINAIDNVNLEKIANKQKVYYTYATPASTVPLNTDQRFFYLAEQPQLFGSFSGSTVNPVFNLQPVPVVLSRSNVAQSDDPVAQANKLNSENVQKFSQIPPVMAVGIEPIASDVQGKSAVVDVNAPVPSVVVDAVNVQNQEVSNGVVQDDVVAQSKVNPVLPEVAVEDNRAEPIPTESDVQLKSAAVAEIRSNPVPITVSNEAVVPIVSPSVDNVEVKDVVVPVSEVGAVKQLDAVPNVDTDIVVPAAVVQQNVQKDQTVPVEQDAKQV